MGRKSLQVKGYSPESIKALFNSDDRYKIGMRLYAVYQVSLGQPSRKLEDFYNTSFKQITNWVHRFEREGLDGLRDKPGRGRRSRLSADQQDRLSKLIMDESPVDYGFNTDTWTGPILIEWIKSQFDIVFKKAQIYNILRKNGFKKWLINNTKLELVYLPPYSPELNPIERAWWYMRKKITHNRYVKTLKERKVVFWKMFSHFQQPNDELLRVCEINY
jgi:transposase